MLRKFIAGLSALLLTAGLVTVIGGAASAHTPSASATCTAVTVDLTKYNAGGVNHVKVTQAGLVTYEADFGTTYQSVLPFVDATKANEWKVEVTAWDDLDKKGKSQGYSKTFSGTTKDCAPPPVVHKVQICHATASQSHPYANDNQWVSWSSVNNVTNINWNGHGDHSGDIIPAFADFPGKNWDATGQAIWNNDCQIPTTTVVPANPTIVDMCGTVNDSITFATTPGVTYAKVGNDVVATLASNYVWGATPAGWVAAAGGKLKFHFDALSTTPCFVIVAWAMPNADNPPSWPQTYVMDQKQTTPNLGALDDELNAIGYGCYQIDIYYDDATTTSLIAGGYLNSPNHPAEHLIPGGSGTAWKFLNVGNSCVHPPVDVCVDNHKQTIDWATYNDGKYELYGANCEQPADLVTDSEWTDGTWACNDTTVEQTGTHTVTPYVKVDGVWVPGTPVVTPTHQTRTLNANEIKPCYVIVAWAMPSWVGPYNATWPQTYVMDEKQTVPDLGALDDSLDAIGYGCYQVDIYFDSTITANLIAGGHLYGSHNPNEDLIPGGWGTAYKLYKVGNSCTPPPVCTIGETSYHSGDPLPAHYVWSDGGPCTYTTPICTYNETEYWSVDDVTEAGLVYDEEDGTCAPPPVCTIGETSYQSGDKLPAHYIWKDGGECDYTPPLCYFNETGYWSMDDVTEAGLIYEPSEEGQGTCREPVEPTLTATITTMCLQNVPFLDWTATMDDPDNQSSNPDNTVSFTFLNTKSADPNWTSDEFGLTDNGDGTWSGSGRFAWPSATYTGSLPGTIVGTGWPGFTYDAIADEWTDVGFLNNGWTRGGVDILAKVNPEYTIAGVKYPAATNPCNPVELSNELDAPPADPVEAEAQYAG